MGGGYYSEAMRITTWNFLHGQPLKEGPNPPKRLEAWRKVYAESVENLGSDLLSLQEVDVNLERSGRTNQSADVAATIGAQWWGFAPSISGTPGVKWRRLKKFEKVVISNLPEEPAAHEIDLSAGYYGISIASKVPVKKWLRLELGRSLIGMPLVVGNANGKFTPLYVKDEPRIAIAAVLENGWTVINTHLSFVPVVNLFQLFRLSSWAVKIEREYSTKVILAGDFNLTWGLPSKLTHWKRVTHSRSYPSWEPKISFDYILTRREHHELFDEIDVPVLKISDHRPLSVDIKLEEG